MMSLIVTWDKPIVCSLRVTFSSVSITLGWVSVAVYGRKFTEGFVRSARSWGVHNHWTLPRVPR